MSSRLQTFLISLLSKYFLGNWLSGAVVRGSHFNVMARGPWFDPGIEPKMCFSVNKLSGQLGVLKFAVFHLCASESM